MLELVHVYEIEKIDQNTRKNEKRSEMKS